MNTKAGRNDPCPCGSGKKYKHCCWGKEEKKSYTPAGKRRFKATVLSASSSTQHIFGQSASTQGIPQEVPEPGSLLKFRKTTKDYQVEKNVEAAANFIEQPFEEPSTAPEEKKDVELPFEPTEKDFRKKEK